MGGVTFFLLHVAVLSAFPFYCAMLEREQRTISFYFYLVTTLAFGGLLGSIYSIPLAEGLAVSGGALMYGAFMMGAVLLVATENSLGPVRSIIHMVIVVDFLVYAIEYLVAYALQSGSMNILGTDPAAFSASLWVVVLGGMLIILELLLLLAVIEVAKARIKQAAAMMAVYVCTYVTILSLDGIVFPVLLGGANPELLAIITGNVKSKLLVAVAFSVPIIGYLSFFHALTRRNMSSPLHLKSLFPFSKRTLREKVRQQELVLNQSADQLHERAERLALSADAAGLGFWSYEHSGEKGGILRMDRICCESHGISEPEFDGTLSSWLEQVHADDRQRLVTILKSINAQYWPASITYRVQLPGGELRYIESYANSQPSLTGEIRLLGVLRDVSVSTQLQQEHSALQEQVYRAQKMESIGQFAGGIAHDFNNLLTPIIGFSELNKSADADRGAIRRDIQEIWKAAHSAQELTNKLLAFGRQQVLQPVVIDLNVLLRDLDSILARLVGENIRRTYELCDGAANITADRGQIEQVLLNLVSNACDAMPDGGTLLIRTHKESADTVMSDGSESMTRQLVLSVTDNGEGIDPETLEHIFEPFFTTKARNKGTGLGLATAFGIVAQHSGTIKASSQPDIGTTVTVTFPSSAPFSKFNKVSVADAELDEPADPNAKDKSILVVEDEAAVSRTIVRILSDQDYRVAVVSDPREALMQNIDSVDLLITDLVMPGMSGLELVRELRTRRPDIPVLFISGYMDGMAMASQERFLKKPFSARDLTMRVRRALKDRSKRDVSELEL